MRRQGAETVEVVTREGAASPIDEAIELQFISSEDAQRVASVVK